MTQPEVQHSSQAEPAWQAAVREHFPPGRKTFLPRPVRDFWICEREKLVYAPIAKCACTSIKALLVSLEQMPHSDLILEHGVHRVTSYAQTGMLMKDLDLDTVRHILTSDDYYKFTVVREPSRRVISAYTEKFVKNRLTEGNKISTRAPLRAVRGTNTPDYSEGISFREFVHYLLRSNPRDLDVHWGFQIHYLDGVNRYNQVFTMEQVDTLGQTLGAITGREIALEKRNSSVDKPADSNTSPGRYVDFTPTELDALPGLSARDFMDPELIAALNEYYARDLQLYEAATKGLQDYQPDPVQLDNPGVLVEPPEIARCVNLYCKGFIGLSRQGDGKLQVLIKNSGQTDIDFGALTGCSLACQPRNAAGETIGPAQLVPISPGLLARGHTASQHMAIAVSAAVLSAIDSFEISLRLGESHRAADYSPLHVTAAQVIIDKD